jgi:carboxyl-terminal processing protease
MMIALMASPLAGFADEPGKTGSPVDVAPFARRVWVITEAVLQNHVEPPSREALLQAAVKGLLAKAGAKAPEDLVDRVAEATTPEKLTALFQELWPQAGKTPAAELEAAGLEALLKAFPGAGHLMSPTEERITAQVEANRYVGTGIQISMPKGEKFARIEVPFTRGPAHRAGARSGDLILSVNGVSMEGIPLQKVVDALRGVEGSACTMVVRQPDEAEPRTLQMTRGVAPFETVLGYRRLGEDSWEFRPKADLPIAYIRVGSISSSNLHELRQFERKLQAEGCRALVLDLRSTGGGSVANAAILADSLLDGGVLWKTTDVKKQTREYTADRDCLFRGWPMAVLVNDYMPPGPIWVAAALQDNHRALLVGDAKPGNHAGYLRGPVHLPDGEGTLLIYTGTVTRPSGDWTLRPDHGVRLTGEQQKAVQAWGALQYRPEGKPDAQPPEDPQLARALEVLKAELDKATATEAAR